MDVTQSHDPWAPEGTKPEAAADEKAPEGDPQGADSAPVHSDDAPGVSAASADSEAHDEPVPGETPGHPVDATTGEPLDLTDEQHQALAEHKLDPSAPAESAGPTEPQAALAEDRAAQLEREERLAAQAEPEAEVTPESENPTTEGEAP